MPIYEYLCHDCRNKFEMMRPVSRSRESAECPRCKKPAERIFSTCYAKTTDAAGITHDLGSSSCSTCSGGNCSSCSN